MRLGIMRVVQVLFHALKTLRSLICGHYFFTYFIMFPLFSPSRHLSHMLIIASVFITLISYSVPQLISYGMGAHFLRVGDYISFIAQIVLFQFLHWGILHLWMNCYFLYQIWPEVEARMSSWTFRAFFWTNTIFTMIALLIFAPNDLTIGISGFAMALLAYLFVDLWTIRHPSSGNLWFLLLLNIAIGFGTNISLVGHASGAVFGILWWYLTKKWLWEKIRAIG